jgi:hypothetical protein
MYATKNMHKSPTRKYITVAISKGLIFFTNSDTVISSMVGYELIKYRTKDFDDLAVSK